MLTDELFARNLQNTCATARDNEASAVGRAAPEHMKHS